MSLMSRQTSVPPTSEGWRQTSAPIGGMQTLQNYRQDSSQIVDDGGVDLEESTFVRVHVPHLLPMPSSFASLKARFFAGKHIPEHLLYQNKGWN